MSITLYYPLKFIAIATGILLLAGSCTEDKAMEPVVSACDSITVTYLGAIQSIMELGCALEGCHDRESVSAGVELTDYDKVRLEAEFGLLLCSVQHGADCVPMPLGGSPLPREQVLKIECWIEAGFPE